MDIKKNRREALKAMAAGTGVLAAGPFLGPIGSALAQQEPIKIACIYPLSGPIAVAGNAMLTGARIAAEQVNRAGGLLGRKIEIVARDDKANPAESALVGREVLGSGIKFIVGGLLTAPGMAIANLLKESNALFVLTGSQIMSMTHENFNENAFRSQHNGRMNLFAAAAAVAEAHPNITKWGGATPDNQFGTDNYRIFGIAVKKAFKERHKKDIQVLDPVLLPFPGNDFKVQISRLMSMPVEGLYTGQVGADYNTFMAQAKQLGLYNKIKVWVDAGVGVAVAKGLGANLPKDNLWSPTPWYPYAKDGNAVSKELVKDYIAMTKDKDVDPGAFNGHTGMMAMLNAIKAAKSLEPAVVKVALERVEFEAANGPFRFRREDHQGIVNVSVIKLSQKAGDPGWEVNKVITVKGESVIEPASPGKPYVEA
jgi:branched-chain amino acid transport system substrate-binding protein